MRRIGLYILLLVFTVSLAHAGGHLHLAADSAPSCAVCTMASQGMAPAPAAAAPVFAATQWIATEEVVVTPSADGRRIYRFAPKVSPPVSARV